jgi:hypothetical protein
MICVIAPFNIITTREFSTKIPRPFQGFTVENTIHQGLKPLALHLRRSAAKKGNSFVFPLKNPSRRCPSGLSAIWFLDPRAASPF